jgi:hypothetical protein
MRGALMDVLSRKAYLALMSLASPHMRPAYKSVAHWVITMCAQRTQFVPREKSDRRKRGRRPRTPGVFDPDDAGLVSDDLDGLVCHQGDARIHYRCGWRPVRRSR